MTSEKNIMCFCGLLTVLFLGLTGIQSEIRAQEIKLTLSSEVTETLVYMPAEIEFHLTNMSDKTIPGIPRLEPEGSDYGVRLHVTFEGHTEELRKPVLHIESSHTAYSSSPYIVLSPHETVSCRILVAMDWYSDYKPVFSKPGLYTLSGSHMIPGIGDIKSNSIDINVRAASAKGEIEAAELLSHPEVLSFYYHPNLLYLKLSKTKAERMHIVESVRKLFEQKPQTPYRKYAGIALKKWREGDIKLKNSDSLGAEVKEQFDLGLTDLILVEPEKLTFSLRVNSNIGLMDRLRIQAVIMNTGNTDLDYLNPWLVYKYMRFEYRKPGVTDWRILGLHLNRYEEEKPEFFSLQAGESKTADLTFRCSPAIIRHKNDSYYRYFEKYGEYIIRTKYEPIEGEVIYSNEAVFRVVPYEGSDAAAYEWLRQKPVSHFMYDLNFLRAPTLLRSAGCKHKDASELIEKFPESRFVPWAKLYLGKCYVYGCPENEGKLKPDFDRAAKLAQELSDSEEPDIQKGVDEILTEIKRARSSGKGSKKK